MKIAYFEGIGWKGPEITSGYIEPGLVRICFWAREKGSKDKIIEVHCFDKENRSYIPSWARWDRTAIAECFVVYASGRKMKLPLGRDAFFNYTVEGLLRLVNQFRVRFEKAVVLPEMAGYSVFGKRRRIEAVRRVQL